MVCSRGISSRKLAAKRLTLEQHDLEEKLRNQLSSFNLSMVLRFFRKQNSLKCDNIKEIHQRKLQSLGVSNDLAPCNPDNVIFNFSSETLSPRLRTIMAFGLDFCLPVWKLDFYNYFARFEKMFHDISREVNGEKLSEFKSKFQTIVCKYFYNFKAYKVFSAILTRTDISLLRKLASNKNIVVCRPDKGRGVVLLDRGTYVERMKEIIGDSSKFEEVKDSIQKFSLKIEDRINNFLRKLKNLKLIEEETFKQLYVSGSGPGILYGLPKIHKSNFAQNFQFRPIFAAFNTASFKIAKFLVPILRPLTSNEYTVSNSYSFVNNICTKQNADKLYMVSFDVENLFKNIPLRETVDICIEKLFAISYTVLGLDRLYFKKLLEHSVLISFFIFDSKLYRQIEGVGMGLPLGQTLANVFMCARESKWLDDCPDSFKPVFLSTLRRRLVM